MPSSFAKFPAFLTLLGPWDASCNQFWHPLSNRRCQCVISVRRYQAGLAGDHFGAGTARVKNAAALGCGSAADTPDIEE